MGELRWVLLGLGVVLVAGIYLWGIRGSLMDWLRKPGHNLQPHHPGSIDDQPGQDPLLRKEPGMGGMADPEFAAEQPSPDADSAEPEAAGSESMAFLEDVEEDGERLNVVVTVMASDDAPFHGLEIAAAAADLGLRKGREGTFDCYPDDVIRGLPVFSIANVLEPGVFDWNKLEIVRSPGLVCFMRLPGSVDSQSALDLMLSVLSRLAERLQGVLCDDRRMRLSSQGIEHLRSEVAEFERRRRLEALRRRQA